MGECLSCLTRQKSTPKRKPLTSPLLQHAHMETSMKDCLTVVLLGHSGVGKSCFMGSRMPNQTHIPTIGLDRRTVNTFHKQLSLWEVTSDPAMKLLAMNTQAKAHAAIILYDITNEDSFYELDKEWLQLTKKIPCILVGTKTDLHKQRMISHAQGLAVAESLQCEFLEISNLSEDSKEQVFVTLLARYQLFRRKPNRATEVTRV